MNILWFVSLQRAISWFIMFCFFVFFFSYLLKLQVFDANGAYAIFNVFDREARLFFGKSAEELHEEIGEVV